MGGGGKPVNRSDQLRPKNTISTAPYLAQIVSVRKLLNPTIPSTYAATAIMTS